MCKVHHLKSHLVHRRIPACGGYPTTAADFLKQFCLPGMEIEATKESILAALDDYQNEHPDPVSYMFEEFKVIED